MTKVIPCVRHSRERRHNNYRASRTNTYVPKFARENSVPLPEYGGCKSFSSKPLMSLQSFQ